MRIDATYGDREWLRLHWRLWDWLAKNPNRPKQDWPEWDNYIVLNWCFACDCAHDAADSSDLFCSYCPLHWPTYCTTDKLLYSIYISTVCGPCSAFGSPYITWALEENLFMKSVYARMIRDLPLHPDYLRRS